MALPSSGAISLNQVNTELQRPATQSINMNDTSVRSLAGKASGAISLADLRGKAWWTLRTGDKWWMTSNTTPAPFIVDGNDYWYGGADKSQLWRLFDGVGGSSQDVFYSQGTINRWAYAWINVINAIRPKTFYVDIADVYGDDWGFEIHGSNDGINWTLLHSNLWRTSGFAGSIEVDSTNAYKYFRIGVSLLYGGISQLRCYKFQLQQWYQQG